MTRKQWKICFSLLLILPILINLPFLPGPNFLNAPAQIIFTIGQIIGMVGLLGVPFGLVWILVSRIRKLELFRPFLYTTIFLMPLLSLVFLNNLFRDFSRSIAIKNGNKLVEQIEHDYKRDDYYPDYIDNSIYIIPHSWIIGISGYKYNKAGDNFELSFTQNVLFGFNFEIVTYNNKGQHKAQGEIKTLHPTIDKNWKYEIYD